VAKHRAPRGGSAAQASHHEEGATVTLEISERSLRLLVYTVAICLLLVFGASPALGAPAVSERTDISGIFEVNECTGEGVELSGSVQS
jgi:hypothetical protein